MLVFESAVLEPALRVIVRRVRRRVRRVVLCPVVRVRRLLKSVRAAVVGHPPLGPPAGLVSRVLSPLVPTVGRRLFSSKEELLWL